MGEFHSCRSDNACGAFERGAPANARKTPMNTLQMPRKHYLNDNYGIRSWLLTKDHKRIAVLYLISITFFFFIGGLFAAMIRMELLTPAGDLFESDTYNKLFTMHGVNMIFFFLI